MIVRSVTLGAAIYFCTGPGTCNVSTKAPDYKTSVYFQRSAHQKSANPTPENSGIPPSSRFASQPIEHRPLAEEVSELAEFVVEATRST